MRFKSIRTKLIVSIVLITLRSVLLLQAINIVLVQNASLAANSGFSVWKTTMLAAQMRWEASVSYILANSPMGMVFSRYISSCAVFCGLAAIMWIKSPTIP